MNELSTNGCPPNRAGSVSTASSVSAPFGTTLNPAPLDLDLLLGAVGWSLDECFGDTRISAQIYLGLRYPESARVRTTPLSLPNLLLLPNRELWMLWDQKERQHACSGVYERSGGRPQRKMVICVRPGFTNIMRSFSGAGKYLGTLSIRRQEAGTLYCASYAWGITAENTFGVTRYVEVGTTTMCRRGQKRTAGMS